VPGSIKNKIVNTDLLEERANRDFDQTEMRNLLHDQEQMRFYDKVFDDMRDHPEIANTHKFYDMSREDQKSHLMKRAFLLYKLNKELYFYTARPDFNQWFFGHQGLSPLGLQYTMFYMSMDKFCNEEQHKKWMPLVQQMRIWGCYA
jgi:hypothetical protein